MNYRLLLAKYIAHVGVCEGAVFIDLGNRKYSARKGVLFSDAEWDELEYIAEYDEPTDVAPVAQPSL